MYQIKDTDTFYRTDPWNKPYDVRVSWLKEAKAKEDILLHIYIRYLTAVHLDTGDIMLSKH